MADLQYFGEDEAEAIVVLQRNTDAPDADYFDHAFMAMMLLEQDRNDAARVHIAAALAHDPDAQYPVYDTALIEVSEGSYGTAETLFLEALSGGLPRRHIRNFIGAMTESGALDRAIAFRHKANQVSAAD
ncbi:hypothetical protein [uncultured Tateyamaria sp.]|uniref:hypothetical protein n=1 Tax=Tateyamaria sp. 1078 TaxID=3417464 RepID=UPI00262EE560|nr:hypothetical protein [uncultured Tateyamaria sp.]